MIKWAVLDMMIKVFCNGGKYPLEIITDINVKVDDLIDQFEQGNMLLIEDKDGQINIINMINVNAIKIINNL